jgi:RHS repeat-associated protein
VSLRFIPNTLKNRIEQRKNTYDLNGNLLNDWSPAGGTNRVFSYDDENELISVYVTNSWQSQFVYDGKMRRRIERDYSWNGSAWVETNEIHFIYDGNVVIQERDINNLPKVTYTRGNDLSGTLQGAGGIGGLLARSDNTQMIIGNPMAHTYYHADGNGNVTMLINYLQAIEAKYLYDPFGNTLSLSGSLASANVYRFSSKEWNDNAGLYYYLYRYYDPNLQRWPNRDPKKELGFRHLITASWGNLEDEVNLYEFVNNAPVFKFDPKGLTIWVCARKAHGILSFANHTYFYNDAAIPANGDCQSCGTSGSSGNGSPCNSNEDGPWGGDACSPVPNSGGSLGNSIMSCCQQNANSGIYIPGGHDCHNNVNNCLQQNGVTPPSDPRLGQPSVGPMNPNCPNSCNN